MTIAMPHVEAAALAETTEAEFMYAYETSASDASKARLGTTVHRMGGGVVLAMRNDPTSYWSKALGFGVESPVDTTLVDSILSTYDGAGLTSATLQIAPPFLPESWPDVVATHHLRRSRSVAKLFADIGHASAAVPPTSLTVRPLDPTDAVEWARVTLHGFGMPADAGLVEMIAAVATNPAFRPFAAWEDRQMVAAGALFVHGRVGSLNAGATLPTHRNRGAQTALIAARIAAARQAGCDYLVAEAGQPAPGQRNQSLENLHRAGLRTLYVRDNWQWTRSVDPLPSS